MVARFTGISPTTINAVTIPPGLKKVEGEAYWSAHPQVSNGFVWGPGNVTDPAHSAMMSAYTYANTLPVTGAVDDRSTILGGQTFTKGVYRWSAPACASICPGPSRLRVADGLRIADTAASTTLTLSGALGDVFIMVSH